MEYIAPIISAVGAIICAWFAYNQKTKDRMTDLKIERYKQAEHRKSKRRAESCAIIYGELWNLIHTLHAARAYIVQPHPLDNESHLTVYFEVKCKGVEAMKPHVQKLPIAEVAKFAAELARNKFTYIANTEQLEDKRAKSMLSLGGTVSAVIIKLSDNTHDWGGNIFCEFTHPTKITEAEAEAAMREAAMNIQYILPPIDEE